MFELHPRLRQDCIVLGRFSLCRLLLMNDTRYPWCILVPEREDATEIYRLEDNDQTQLLKESSRLARAMYDAFHPDKLNIAAIGNLIPQLHVHHVARFKDDAAWPAPVWGLGTAIPYQAARLAAVHENLYSALGEDLCWMR